MMAAQGLDVLWQCSCMSLVLFVVATSGSKTGMLAVFYAHQLQFYTESRPEQAVFCVQLVAEAIRFAAVAFCRENTLLMFSSPECFAPVVRKVQFRKYFSVFVSSVYQRLFVYIAPNKSDLSQTASFFAVTSVIVLAKFISLVGPVTSTDSFSFNLVSRERCTAFV